MVSVSVLLHTVVNVLDLVSQVRDTVLMSVYLEVGWGLTNVGWGLRMLAGD